MKTTKSDRTRHSLEMALLRIEKKRPRIISKERKLSILAVAEEANVSGASIHNNYPDIAERIRIKIRKKIGVQRNSKDIKLKIEIKNNKMLRVKILELTKQLRDIASENATLLTENKSLNAIINGGNVVLLKGSK